MDTSIPPTKPTLVLAPEILLMIVQHVGDQPTLYSLLTTSKVLFDAAVRRLYLDPFAYTEHSPEMCERLCKWILTLSSSTRQEIEALREEMQISRRPSHPQTGEGVRTDGPYIDYLSLVKHVEILFIGEHDFQAAVELKKKMLPVLPWAICPDGRFSQLSTITIISDQVNAYLPTIPSMTKLQTVIWDPTPYHRHRNMPNMRRFVEAFVAAHGDRGRKLIMFFETCEDIDDEEYFDEIEGVIPELVDIYRLLDPFPPTKRSIIRGNSWMRCLAHKDKMDFGNIQEIDVNFDEELEGILPRCHQLESLRCEDGLISTRIFQWAVEECRKVSEEQGQERHPPSIPPLKKIDLFVDRAVIATTMRDIRTCFSSTLESLELCFTSSTELFAGFSETEDLEQDEYSTYVAGARVLRVGSEWNVPKLQHLRLYGTDTRCFMSVDPTTTFSGTPNLETLVLGDSSSLHEDPEELYREEDQDPDLVDDALIKQVVLKPCRIWNLPKLRELGLRGASAAQFHPETLLRTRDLEDLTLNMRSAYMGAQALASLWKMPGASGNGGWHWPLPRLKRLFLSGPGALVFNLGALEMMPELEQVTLVAHDHPDMCGSYRSFLAYKTYTPELGGSLRSLLTYKSSTPEMRFRQAGHTTIVSSDGVGGSNGASEDESNISFTNLRYLYLKGHWEASEYDLFDLFHPKRLPQLQEFWMTGLPWPNTGMIVDMAARHPSLKVIWITTHGQLNDINEQQQYFLKLNLEPTNQRPTKEEKGFVTFCIDHHWFRRRKIKA
ncbi:hypothetical protein BGW41_004905 [Actinomortierella wolfii]|nr:hypothetical protein BGW41_004905 [Actinomortierella wolfii]